MKQILFISIMLAGFFASNLSAQNYNQLYENTPDGPRYINEDENEWMRIQQPLIQKPFQSG